MRPIGYAAAQDTKAALEKLASRPTDAVPIGGGTNLVDLMKIQRREVYSPATLEELDTV